MILSVVLKPDLGIQISIDKSGTRLSIHLSLISLGYLNSIVGVRRTLWGCWTKMRFFRRWFSTWYPFRGYLLLDWASSNSVISLCSVTQRNHRHCSATHTNQFLAWCGKSCGWRIVATKRVWAMWFKWILGFNFSHFLSLPWYWVGRKIS